MRIFVGFDRIPIRVEPNDTFLSIREKAAIVGNLFVLNGEIVLEEDMELSEFPMEDGTLLEVKESLSFKFGRYKIFFVDGECIGDIENLRNISDQIFEMMLIHNAFFDDEEICISIEKALNDVDKTTSLLKYTNTLPVKIFRRYGASLLLPNLNFTEIIIERIRNYTNLFKKNNADCFQTILEQLILYGNLSDENCVSVVNNSYRMGTYGIKLIIENSTLSRFINDSKVAIRCVTYGDMGTFINIVNFLSNQKLMEIHNWISVTNGNQMFIQLIEQNITERFE